MCFWFIRNKYIAEEIKFFNLGDNELKLNNFVVRTRIIYKYRSLRRYWEEYLEKEKDKWSQSSDWRMQ